MIALENDTEHDRVCKSVTEIKGHAKNFQNAPRILRVTIWNNDVSKLVMYSGVAYNLRGRIQLR